MSLRKFLIVAVLTGPGVTWAVDSPRSEEPIILPPLKAGPEAALLIVPGAYINAQYYQPLGEAIQEASPLQLWVGLVRPFPFDLPNPISLLSALNKTMQMMKDQGMTTDDIFLAGHSLGGTVLQNEQWSEDNGVLAWIMLASYIPEGNLANNTLPVMHISGDLDGMTRITRIMSTFVELEALLEDTPESKYEKPVIVLEDVNHMHFASGDPPSLVAKEDILSPMAQDEAQSLIARHIASYLTVVSGQPPEEIAMAQEVLLEAFDNTAKAMQPLKYLKDYSEGDGERSPWSEQGQRIVSAVLEQYHNSLEVNDQIYGSVYALASSRPVIELAGDKAVVNTCTHVYPHSILTTTGDLAASEIGAKFKSREAIMQVLEPLGVEFGDMVTCKEVNQVAFELALNCSSDISRSRFESRGGQVTFHDDLQEATGSGWLYSHLQYNLTVNDLEVTSPTLVTSVDVSFGLGGMHYCKLLPPSRALEYIMVDSLKHTQPV
ncbi:uncharacterized protein [Palaemon carinicauda]|uniref:uncharacterized protein n=1 Tax=Palaemon carinicauda TaxID=392227 RepID=UPI0035B64E31